MHALSLHNLRKTYKTGVEALKGIDLVVEEGDFFALLGPNGAGKSTTIGVISSLVTKSAGVVKIFNYDLDEQRNLAKAQLGLVGQEFNFNQFEKVVQILINQAGYYGVPRSVASQRVEPILHQLGLWEKRDTYARQLSGGMKRRLMIARALVHQPRLLILDEPTAGVDIELRRSLWALLNTVNRAGTTIILTTHYLEEAESLCRNIAIIDKGRIIENTSIKKLLSKLNVETFILDVTFPPYPFVIKGDYTWRVLDDHTLEIDLKRGQLLNELFAQLSEQKIQVLSMRNKTNRLEELFLKLVEKTGS